MCNYLKKNVHIFLKIYFFFCFFENVHIFLKDVCGLKTGGMSQTHFRGSTNEYLNPNKAKWGPNQP